MVAAFPIKGLLLCDAEAERDADAGIRSQVAAGSAIVVHSARVRREAAMDYREPPGSAPSRVCNK